MPEPVKETEQKSNFLPLLGTPADWEGYVFTEKTTAEGRFRELVRPKIKKDETVEDRKQACCPFCGLPCTVRSVSKQYAERRYHKCNGHKSSATGTQFVGCQNTFSTKQFISKVTTNSTIDW